MESKNSSNFDFGANLLRLREENFLSQEELGGKVGVTGAAIGQYERNEVTPRKKRQIKLAEALGVTLGELNGYSSVEKHTPVHKVGSPEVITQERHLIDLQRLTDYQEKKIADLEKELAELRRKA